MTTAFISSTALDLPDHRKQAMAACLQMAIIPTAIEQFPADSNDALSDSLSMVDRADIYIGIVGYRYGYVPPGQKSSVTELEYRRASERGIRRLMFFMADDHPVRMSEVDTGELYNKLLRFKEHVMQELAVSHYHSPEDLRLRILQALAAIRDHFQQAKAKTESRKREGKQRELLRVFVASPRDVWAERQCMPRVIDSLNRTLGKLTDTVIELWRWEADAPPGVGEPQALIDPELDEADAVVVIFWNRFGLATKTGTTGTESEVLRSMEKWKRVSRPQVMMYFCQRPARLNKDELMQRGAVLNFRERVEPLVLSVDYEEISEFEWRVRDDLFLVLHRLRSDVS